MEDIIIGVDLAKRIFQLHGATGSGEILFRKRLTPDQFLDFMSRQSPSSVVFEGCSNSSYWAREMQAFGHEVRLIAPQYVKPFAKRQKNDATDVEAVDVAARQPEMRFVSPKSEERQARAGIFRARERLVRQRTELMNGLRDLLHEYGAVFPVGRSQTKRIEAHIDTADAELPALVVAECQDILLPISEQTARIETKTRLLARLAASSKTSRRLQTMPSVGPITALAVEAFAPEISEFRCGRDFAAWLGLVPRQYSSGGKERPGRVSKAGQIDIRRLLIIDAMSTVIGRGAKNIIHESWLGRMTQHKPKMLTAIALANKMARQIWAMLIRGEVSRCP
jgi:transposase